MHYAVSYLKNNCTLTWFNQSCSSWVLTAFDTCLGGGHTCRDFYIIEVMHACIGLGSVERKWVFATNSKIIIPTFVQPDVEELWYLKLWIIWNNESLSLKYERFTTSGFKEIGIRKFEFAATTQFLWKNLQHYNSHIRSKLS